MTGQEWLRVMQAVVRVMADSTRTEEIHRVEELTGRAPYRRLQALWKASPEYEALLADRPELSSAHLNFDALRALPPDTLGGAYIRHLDSNGLSADYQAAPTLFEQDPEVAYLMRRFRQTHDVWHALLGLGIQGHEEVIIHAFSWGQLRLPVSAMIVVLGSLKHIVLEGRRQALRRGLWEAYRLGREAYPLLLVRWESMWTTPLEKVRDQLNVRPCTPAFIQG